MRVFVVGDQERLFTYGLRSSFPDWDVTSIPLPDSILRSPRPNYEHLAQELYQLDGDALVIADEWGLICHLAQCEDAPLPILAGTVYYSANNIQKLRSKGIYPFQIPAPLDDIMLLIEEQIPVLKREFAAVDRGEQASKAAFSMSA